MKTRLTRMLALLLALCLTLGAVCALAVEDDTPETPVEETEEPTPADETESPAEDAEPADETVVEETEETTDEPAGEAVPISVVAADPAEITVTIADAGALVLSCQSVTAEDLNADGIITIDEALVCTHNLFFEGGAEAGYASADGDYGLYITKLWGVENGGSYGYYVNNASAWSLSDPLTAGDHLVAFTYADTEGFSDQYSFFQSSAISTLAGEVTVTLSAAGYDAEWNPVTLPVAGATLTLNGEATTVVTAEDGTATLTLTEPGTYLLSATSDSQLLVPPTALITVCRFSDTVGHWAQEEIESVAAAGLMTGATETTFDANATMTRAQLVTVLWRMAGEPAVEGELSFTDVKAGAYYETAVLWANQNGIVSGTSETTFSPNAPVTRQQLATFLHRYAVLQTIDVSVGESTNLLSYQDVDDIDDYAMAPMQWACGAGLISGTGAGVLQPDGQATRAQVAVILARFLATIPMPIA